ncbi:MAG: 2Fe-2S iron-sulfur cluster-binding protein [Kiloniellaceae bacterium]
MTARTISLTVNGRPVTAAVEPRTHLADFLREELLLTGTHLGCEHGICGACTVAIDGQIARACITYAVACDGAEVRTIEGFDDDPLMARLRDAFAHEHGLQCGYCTPGMLIAARDLVLRLPEADDRRIRVELSGNLCRCTGYAGIVNALGRVLAERRAGGEVAPPRPAPLGPAPGPGHVARPGAPAHREVRREMPAPAAPARVPPVEGGTATHEAGMTRLAQSFEVPFARETVWVYFADIEKVAGCMPGARLTAPVADDRVAGEIAIRLGPISAAFAGEASLARDERQFRGVIEGTGRDRRSASRAKGRIEYRLHEADGGAATRVDVSVAFSLAGPLAQFSRGAIVADLAKRLTAEFARNLEARLAGGETKPAESEPPPPALDAGALLISVILARVKAFLAGLFRRS